MRTFSEDEVRATLKSRDAWWTVALVDPVAVPLVRRFGGYPWVTPNRITAVAFVLGLGAAASFLMGSWPWLVAGAVLFHLSFVFDCMDGKVARLRGNGSAFGAWLDFIADRVKDLTCTAGLMGGQYLATGEAFYLALGALVLFINMFRYLNASQMAKVKAAMRYSLAEARQASVPPDQRANLTPLTFLEEVLVEVPTGSASAEELAGADQSAVIDLNRGFRTRFSRFIQVRNWLRRRRIRPHLVSGIEFQMAVFVIGPLTGAIVPVTIGAAILLLVFEAALIYKLWLSTKSFNRQLARLTSAATGQDTDGDPRGNVPALDDEPDLDGSLATVRRTRSTADAV